MSSIKDPSLNDVLRTLKRWEVEAKNPRNDGWVTKDYKNKIRKVFSESARLLRKNK
jgi:hypothetical protein|tara:strand:- start:6097 stop:6264 length:168 start_codon:yes stop_codon:yes gene_type:complete